MFTAARKKQCRKVSPRSANGANAFSSPSRAAGPVAVAPPPLSVVGGGGGTLLPSVPSPNTLDALLANAMALGGDGTPALGVVAPAQASLARPPVLSSIDKKQLSEKKSGLETKKSKLESQQETLKGKLEDAEKEWAERVRVGQQLETSYEEKSEELAKLTYGINSLESTLVLWRAQKQEKELECIKAKQDVDANTDLAVSSKSEILTIKMDMEQTAQQLVNVDNAINKLADRDHTAELAAKELAAKQEAELADWEKDSIQNLQQVALRYIGKTARIRNAVAGDNAPATLHWTPQSLGQDEVRLIDLKNLWNIMENGGFVKNRECIESAISNAHGDPRLVGVANMKKQQFVLLLVMTLSC